jgi:2-methylcitrate dehydratase
LCMRDGRIFEREQHDYEGFHTRPMSWETVAAKFRRLASGHVESETAARIQGTTASLEELGVAELADLLARPKPSDPTQRT